MQWLSLTRAMQAGCWADIECLCIYRFTRQGGSVPAIHTCAM